MPGRILTEVQVMNRRDAFTTVALAGIAVAASLEPAAAETAPVNSALERIKRTGVLRVAYGDAYDPFGGAMERP